MGSSRNLLNLTPQEEEEDACAHAMQLSSASVLPMVLKAAVELDGLEIIAAAGHGAFISTTDIASKLATSNSQAHVTLDRMLRLLASYKVVSCNLLTNKDGTMERLYGLTPVCKFLVKNEDGVSLAPLVLMNQDKVHMESWYHMKKDAVLDGVIPYNKAHGLPAFEYFGTNQRFNEVFNKAMSDHSTITMKKILDIYKGFEGVNTLVDVGGGVGATLNMIIDRHLAIKGINFDLAHVIAEAQEYPGVKHIVGDMFASVPKGDAIFMKWILHDWSDEHCLNALKNCHEALPANGKMIIVEAITPEFPESNLAANGVFQLDNIMLAHCPGGKERSGKGFEALSVGAGFSGFKVICGAFNNWVMEFSK